MFTLRFAGAGTVDVVVSGPDDGDTFTLDGGRGRQPENCRGSMTHNLRNGRMLA